MGRASEGQTPDGFFRGSPEGVALFNAVKAAVEANVWRPDHYVTGEIPAVLSIALPREISSDRIRSVAHPSNKVWMHHIELSKVSQIDDEVCIWLAEAYETAR